MVLNKHQRKRKILILWYSINNNLGDYYLFNTVKNHAVKWGFDVDSMDVGMPYKEIAKVAKKCDWIWFAGGGIIERGVPDIIEHFPEFFKKIKKSTLYGVTGISLGEFNYESKANQLSLWVNKASFFYVRDDYSSSVLNGYSGNSKVISTSDVVLAYDGFWNCGSHISNNVGINFREMPYKDLTGGINCEAWYKSIKKSISNPIVIIPDQDSIIKQVDNKIDYEYTPQSAVASIASIDFGIAMRYHVILIAAMMGKVCIPIDYCPKVTRLAEQLGIGDIVLHYNEVEKVNGIIEMYNKNRDYYVETVNKNVIAMKEKTIKMFLEIESIMKECIL